LQRHEIMKSQEELMRSRGYWIANIQLDLFRCVDEYMKENKLNRSQFAERLGVTKGYVSQILNGNFNHNIATFVDLTLAIGKVPRVVFEDLEERISQSKKVGKRDSEQVVRSRKPATRRFTSPPVQLVQLVKPVQL
jgi:transcriptional regulator with XRE-family HTH domain